MFNMYLVTSRNGLSDQLNTLLWDYCYPIRQSTEVANDDGTRHEYQKSIIQFHNSLKDIFALNCIWIRSNIFYSEGYSDETVHHYHKSDFPKTYYVYVWVYVYHQHQKPNTEWHRTLQRWSLHQGARFYFFYLFIYFHQILVQLSLAQFVAPHFFRAAFWVGCNPAPAPAQS